MSCTCGARSVSSSLHSSWCDVVAKRGQNAFDLLREEGLKVSNGRFIYLAKDAQHTYRRFRNYLDYREWTMSAQYPDSFSIVLNNGTEITFISDSERARGLSCHGVLVDVEGLGDLESWAWTLVRTENGWVHKVKGSTQELLPS